MTENGEAPHFYLQVELQGNKAEVSIEADHNETGKVSDLKNFDDDGRIKRQGTLWTASAHIITAVIGSGVLSLAWAIAQLGWIAGPAAMLAFSFVTFYTSCLLADCYRSSDPVTGKRNYTYMDAVRANLDGVQVWICGFTQYANLVGTAIGYTIAASISMTAIQRSDCFRKNGHDSPCHVSNNPYMLIFGVVEIILSQIPDFDQLWWLSIVAAVMSFTYSTIGLGLGVGKVIELGHFRGSLTGTSIGTVTEAEKIWRTFQALGNIAFAYSYSMILIEIQDTLKSPPAENKTMKKATLMGVSTTTVFYMLCGCMGYAAFGDNAPGNLLTGFGFYNPFWVIDIANAAIVIHLVGAYQVYCQPLFAFIESWSSKKMAQQSVHQQGIPSANSILWSIQCQPLQTGLENYFCNDNHIDFHASAVLQQRPWTSGCCGILAINCVFPSGNVYFAEENPTLDIQVDCSSHSECSLSCYFNSSCKWVHSGHC